MNRKNAVFILFLFLYPLSGFSQYYLTGQDPASVKWQQIKTGKFQIVFPKEYQSVAQYYANVLELSSPFVSNPYIKKQKPVTIVLHNRSTISNALVSPAPFHADFFETPSQTIYPQIWQDQLALHEYRHVVQMTKLRQGFTKGLFFVFGEQGVAAIFGSFLPLWFVEGDAVYSETLHSKSGRGRIPSFSYKLKAQVLDKKVYSYDKAQFGSFRDFSPDHYTLGYQLVTYGTRHYGLDMWNRMLTRVARKPFTLIPFTYSLKKSSGKGKVGFYRRAMTELTSKWKLNDVASNDTFIPVKDKYYTDYLFPQILSDGSIVCEKAGLDDVHRFVRLSRDGTEKQIFTPGFDFKASLSANDSLLCWNEKSYDLRWSNRDYSVIKLYNFKSHKLITLTHKSRYFAPAISHNGKWIVTSEISTTGEYALLFLNATTGKVIQKIKTGDNLFFITPHWSADDRFVVAFVLGKKGKQLVLVSRKTRKITPLSPFTFAEVKWPVMYDDFVVFTGTFEGKDELYALQISTKKLFKVSNARFGSTFATFSPDGKSLIYAAYTADGYKPAHLPFSPALFKKFKRGPVPFRYPVDSLVADTTFILENQTVPHSVYPVKKYSRLGHLFNPYSWGPLSIDANNYTVQPGITLLSQNKLSTAVSSLSYLYDLNEQTGKTVFGFDYYGWYPVVSLHASYGGRRQYAKDKNDTLQEVRWKETNLSLTLSIPLNFTTGKWIRGIRPSVSFHQRFLKMNPHSKFSFKENSLSISTVHLFTYVQMKRSAKDIFPSFGFWMDALYRKTLFSDSLSQQTAFQGAAYLPGIIKHQGIRMYAALQRTRNGYYPFSHAVFLPRGYSGLQFSNFLVVRTDYALPIAYPDWDVPALFYLKRMYAHLFYDYLYDLQNKRSGKSSSTGIELYTDWHFLSLFPEVELGVRFSHLIDKNNNTFDFLFNVSF